MGYLKDELTGFVPVEQSKDIMKDVARGSSILRLSKVSTMESDTKKVPVMAEGPGAYWVGEGERIQTSKAGWIYPELKAKKLAVIIPVTKEKLNDTTIDVFEELKEPIAEAFYKAIDAAGFFGTNSPFAKNIMNCVETSGNKIEVGTNETLDLDVSDAMALVEEDGYDVNGFAAKIFIAGAVICVLAGGAALYRSRSAGNYRDIQEKAESASEGITETEAAAPLEESVETAAENDTASAAESPEIAFDFGV
jgi:hypothetical protein